MSAKKPSISQIDQYLKGKLDARAMHKLERQAQDDPFLMDALQGYEQSGKDQQANLAELNERLAKRVAPAKERSIILWRVLPLAASVLVMLGVGYWFFKPAPAKKQYANVIVADKKPQPALTPPSTNKETIVKQSDGIAKNVIVTDNKSQASLAEVMPMNPTILKESPIASEFPGLNLGPGPTYKKDTIEYIASNYKTRPNAKVDELLKKLEGLEVDEKGNVTSQGQSVTKAKLNGKDFAGGDITQATKNLPADILEKIQIVDDYGDQAAKTGIKTGDPQKVLNLITDTINKQNLIAANRPAPVLKEVKVTNPLTQSKVVGRATGISNVNPDANNRQVTGTVLDDKGFPVSGAYIKIDGVGSGTMTDMNGNFKIDMPANKDLLAVNSIGFSSKQVKVGDQKDLKIALEATANNLNEVVIAGYGPQKNQNACTENLDFKKEFFDNISTAEKFVSEQVTHVSHTIKQTTYKKALQFIAKHTKVPMGTDYASMAYFQADKKLWLNWYEANKCNNLK